MEKDIHNYKSSILRSIFERKGGEGLFTKLVTEQTFSTFSKQISLLDNGEEPVVCYKKSETNWMLISNRRLIVQDDNNRTDLNLSDITSINLAIQEELRAGVSNPLNFSKIFLSANGQNTVISVEPGYPFEGIFQLLSFVENKNRTDKKID